ncbi:MAG: hypothetical protein AABN95_20895 [Acidobacteriota bacterium]
MNNNKVYHSQSFLIETKVDPTRQLVLATTFVIRGFPFVMCMGTPGHPQQFGFLRPQAIVFRSGKSEMALEFCWSQGPASNAVFLDRAGSYDGPPPDWQDWEKNG